MGSIQFELFRPGLRDEVLCDVISYRVVEVDDFVTEIDHGRKALGVYTTLKVLELLL